MNANANIAPPLQTSQWLNSPTSVTLDSLRGRVVVLHTFQMLCPGCVSHGLPQALRIHALFPPDMVAVIGLHMEPWLIGHTVELRAASVDICSLRLSTARQNPDAQALAAGRLLNEWLDDLGKSSVRFGWS